MTVILEQDGGGLCIPASQMLGIMGKIFLRRYEWPCFDRP